jgi:hypothetical protein
MMIRLEQVDIPKQFIGQAPSSQDISSPLLSEAVELYLRLKGGGRGKTFFQAANRNAAYLIKVAGDKPINNYTFIEAGQFRDLLVAKGMTIVTVKRVFTTVRAIDNIAFCEYRMDTVNLFSLTFIPVSDEKEIHMPIPMKPLLKLQFVCREYDDEPRLSEVEGLAVLDIQVDVLIP